MMEHYPDLKKDQTVELEGYEFKLESIEQGFMRWFIVTPIKKDEEKDDQSSEEK